MGNQFTEMLLTDLAKLNEEIGEERAKQFNLKQLERIIKRLGSFSSKCEECEKFLLELNQQLEKLMNTHGHFEKMDMKEYRSLVNAGMSHLQKTH